LTNRSLRSIVLLRWLQRADIAGRWCENALLIILFLALLGLATTQILLRNVFSSGLFWADELVRLLVLWLAVVGAVAATRDGRNIAIELVARSLPELLRRLARCIVAGFAAVVSGTFAWQAWLFVSDSREFGETVLGGWPAWYFQIVLPAGFAVMTLQFAVSAIVAWRRDRS
jgi:TRAP-type C4-dicarboxylate transport system permease small subunit